MTAERTNFAMGEENRKRIEALTTEMSVLKNQYVALVQSFTEKDKALLDNFNEKHSQNRKDIHILRNDVQIVTNKMVIAIESVTTQVREYVDELKEDIHNMELKAVTINDPLKAELHRMELDSAKAKGKWLGIGVAASAVIEVARYVIPYVFKHLSQ
jgi:hypothetical protein